MPPADHEPRILGLGIACLDYLFVAPHCPPGGQGPLRGYAVAGGGLVATALAAAARLGAAAAIRTWVGDDGEGEQVIAGLREGGVEVGGVAVIAGGRTPVSFIHVETGTGERTIYHPAGRLEVDRPGQEEAAAGPLDCDVLLVDDVWPEASLVAARAARRQGIPVVADFTPGPELAELAALVTALIVPRGGAARLAPAASEEQRLARLAATGAEFVAITAGAEGCYYLDGGAVRHQPAFPVEVVDTTGAGDVFHGAFAYALARRRPMARAMEFAAAVAALSCRGLGGRGSLPTREETLAFLQARGSGRGE